MISGRLFGVKRSFVGILAAPFRPFLSITSLLSFLLWMHQLLVCCGVPLGSKVCIFSGTKIILVPLKIILVRLKIMLVPINLMLVGLKLILAGLKLNLVGLKLFLVPLILFLEPPLLFLVAIKLILVPLEIQTFEPNGTP